MTGWRLNTSGRNRFVILTRRYAVKVPSLRSWQDFLYGLLNNRTEARVGTSGRAGVCPVLWYVPGGWLVVMPRVPIMTAAGLQALDVAQAVAGLSVEIKPDSFGLYNGHPVAVDYGWGQLIYVDDADLPASRKGYYRYSHMAADSLEELHAFAAAILRLRRHAFHADAEHPHYDVNQWQRRDAITCGAIPVRPRELLTIAKCAKLNSDER